MKLHPNVAICVPGGPVWDNEFALCLNMLTIHILTRPMKAVRQVQFSLINERGSNLSKIRHSLVCKALERKADYVLFLDTDQTFPSNTLYRMMAWDKPIVACNVPIKAIPSTPTARSYAAEHPHSGHIVYSDPEKHGLEQVWRVGTGVMLVKTEVFKEIGKPYFDTRYIPEVDDWMGEDWWFLDRAETAGIAPVIDHDLSREVGHRGTFTVTHDWVGQVVREEIPSEKEAVDQAKSLIVTEL